MPRRCAYASAYATVAQHWLHREFRRQHLQCDMPIKLQTAAEVHGAHATAPQFAFNGVAALEPPTPTLQIVARCGKFGWGHAFDLRADCALSSMKSRPAVKLPN